MRERSDRNEYSERSERILKTIDSEVCQRIIREGQSRKLIIWKREIMFLFGNLEKVITVKIYDKDGKFIGEGAKIEVKPLVRWYEVVTGLTLAFVIVMRLYA